jgi:hypothetical protein
VLCIRCNRTRDVCQCHLNDSPEEKGIRDLVTRLLHELEIDARGFALVLIGNDGTFVTGGLSGDDPDGWRSTAMVLARDAPEALRVWARRTALELGRRGSS